MVVGRITNNHEKIIEGRAKQTGVIRTENHPPSSPSSPSPSSPISPETPTHPNTRPHPQPILSVHTHLADHNDREKAENLAQKEKEREDLSNHTTTSTNPRNIDVKAKREDTAPAEGCGVTHYTQPDDLDLQESLDDEPLTAHDYLSVDMDSISEKRAYSPLGGLPTGPRQAGGWHYVV